MARGAFRHFYYVILLLLVIASCAKVSSPSGGPRDRMPPVVVKNIPENGTRNFKGNKITITFDEYVVLNEINEKFMVSPPMAKKPAVEIRGKSIVIEYGDELHDSTTYTFYFGDAVRDLNEGNILNNYQFVFSTGPVIDSLSVTGNVYQAFTLDPPENTTVLLYNDLDVLNVTKKLPDYISKTDQNGYFRIDNVRAGKYLLYALGDEDNSKNFNLPDENIAFLDFPIEVTPEKNYSPIKPDTLKPQQTKTKPTVPDTTVRKGEYRLILFEPEKKQHYLTSSSRDIPYELVYTLSLPPDSLNFDFSVPGIDPKSYFIERSREKDTIRVWITDSTLYSQQEISTLITYPLTDTTGKTFQKKDTVLMRYLVPRLPRARPRPVPLKVTPSLSGGALKPGQNIVFKSQTPLRDPDTSKIQLYETDGTKRIKIPFNITRDTANSCRITMKAKYEQGKKYLFVADSAAFSNLYGLKSDSTGIIFSADKEQNYGKLILNVTGFEGNRIIQLLDNNENVLREIIMQKNGKTEFPLLDKSKYKLRTIYDLNGDNKWTTGDYMTKRQPEPVSFYYKEINVSENFEITEDWNISQMNYKKLRNPVKKSNVR